MTNSIIRLRQKAKVPVYPVYFDFQNTNFFYWMGNISWKLRTIWVTTEAFNKKGKTLDVYIGDPISADVIQQYTNDNELADFLYNATYGSK